MSKHVATYVPDFATPAMEEAYRARALKTATARPFPAHRAATAPLAAGSHVNGYRGESRPVSPSLPAGRPFLGSL